MTTCKFKPFTRSDLNMATVRSILKGSSVQAALKQTASSAQVKANTAAHVHFPDIKVDPYGSDVNVHANVAVGRVFTRTELGVLDQSKHHTLDDVRGSLGG